ncbi:unnamed protein product [Rotaria sp. Silwood2]|nr:unnamed protein product [Rotaria sp. Silwood2]CAF4416812.1 unnamed protein product [Rotaria sp. Silwood2]
MTSKFLWILCIFMSAHQTTVGLNSTSTMEPTLNISLGPNQKHGTYNSYGQCICDCASSSSSCFSGDSFVTLANGKRILINQLQPGDVLLTSDGSSIITTEHIMFLDKKRLSKVLFYTITTESNHSISLTPLHLLPVKVERNSMKYIPAKQVQIGDLLYVALNGQLITSAVTDIIIDIKIGAFAPMTMSGTLLVDNILAGNYANVKSHDAAHLYMAPLRWYYSLNWFSSKPKAGVPPYDMNSCTVILGAKPLRSGFILFDPFASLTGARHLFINYFISQSNYGLIEGGFIQTTIFYTGISTVRIKPFGWDHDGLQW